MCFRRKVSEWVRTKTSEQQKHLELQQVIMPPEAPREGIKWHLSKAEPANEHRKERANELTFVS